MFSHTTRCKKNKSCLNLDSENHNSFNYLVCSSNVNCVLTCFCFKPAFPHQFQLQCSCFVGIQDSFCAIAGQTMHYFDESLLNRSFHSKLPLALAKNAAKGKLINPTGYMESSEID